MAKDWSVDPHMKKATFNDAEGRIDVERALSAEDQKWCSIFEDDGLDEAFVILDKEK